jgi:flagellar assembly factor FliW
MIVKTTRFGEINLEEEDRITLADGMLGFPDFREYVLIQHREGSPFRWLQSLNEPSLAFLVVPPAQILNDYSPTIAEEEAAAIGVGADSPLLTFVVVTIPKGNPHGMTVNLAGPIIINPENRFGRQIVVENTCYGTKHSVLEGLQTFRQVAA